MGDRESQHLQGRTNLPAWTTPTAPDYRSRYSLHSDCVWGTLSELPSSGDVLDYWHILWLKKFAILRFAVFGLVLALCFSLFQRPVYRARTSIAIQDLNENFLNLKEDPTAINPAGPAESYFQTQVQILHSESLLQRVIERPAISQALGQEQVRGRSFPWREYLGLAEPIPSVNPQRAVDNVASRLSVRSFGETRLVQVFFESGDPKFAADFANTLVKEFVEQSHQMRWESTQRTAEWLTGHLNEMKRNLENGEGQLQSYARDSGLMFSETRNVEEDKLRQLQEEYSKAQVERAQKQAKYETAISKPLESLPEALDDPTVRDLGLKLAELQQQKAQLTSALTPAHYRVRQAQAQIDELTSALEAQRKRMAQRTANEYRSAQRHEQLLAGAYEKQVKTVSKQAEKAIHYDTLKHEVDTSRQLYDALVQRVKQAGIAAAMRASNILVVDKAKAPLLPFRPNIPLNCTLGFLIGAFSGVGVSILRERLNRHIVSPGVAPAYLNLPELGAIPLIAIPGSRIRGFLSARGDSVNSISFLPAEENGGRVVNVGSAEGAADRAELFMVAEAFRATITSLLLPAFEGSSTPRLIVLSSPGRGAGKTTVTCNLGLAMAQIGRRVLLVDADLRRPTLHEGLKVSNSWGLCDLLCSNDPINQIGVSGLVRHTDVQGLDVLPSGRMQKDPTHLLYSARVVELFERLRREYDVVLVDTAPMMLLADARMLGRIADGAVLVLRAGHTTLAQAQVAVQRLAEDGTRVLGTVLNGWDPNTASGTDYADSYSEYKKKITEI
jgi:succinoglycan biosynthesis transport protein ExoP